MWSILKIDIYSCCSFINPRRAKHVMRVTVLCLLHQECSGSVTKLKTLTSMNRNYLENGRVEFCKTLYLLRYGTFEHPRALSFEATPFNHAQSVSVRYLELLFHVVGFGN